MAGIFRHSSFVVRLVSAVPLIFLVMLLLSACNALTAPASSLTLGLSVPTSTEPMLREMAGAFTSQRPDTLVNVQVANTTLSLEALARGEVAIAAASWLPTDLARDWLATPIAWDGVAIVVHRNNPVAGVTLLQLRQIFAGWAFRWQDVGAPPADDEADLIQVISREDGAGTRAVFEPRVMGDETVTLTALVLPNSRAVVDYVASHVEAVGYVSMAEVDARVRALAIEGVAPTPETVRAGAYHLAHPLYLVTRGAADASARAFVDFAVGPAGQSLISQRYGRVR